MLLGMIPAAILILLMRKPPSVAMSPDDMHAAVD
jgi:hypothetical protein